MMFKLFDFFGSDNAWMETVVMHFEMDDDMSKNFELMAGDDAKKAKWIDLTEENIQNLYASHSNFVRQLL